MLIGDGPERYNVERLCRELGLCDKVLMVGKISDTSSLLSLTDLFLLPSETESFGLAALEAMAVGVPVVSSDTGGIPEVNINGYCGYMSKVGDVEDMAKNSIKILSDEKTLSEYKHNAIERAKEFSLDNVLPKYEKLYDEVLAGFKEKLG